MIIKAEDIYQADETGFSCASSKVIHVKEAKDPSKAALFYCIIKFPPVPIKFNFLSILSLENPVDLGILR